MSNIVEKLGKDTFEQIIRTKLTEHILKNNLDITPPWCYVRDIKEENGKAFVTIEFLDAATMKVKLVDNELIPIEDEQMKKKKKGLKR